MKKQATASPDKELIFYLKERAKKGSDYTFYLVRDGKNTVFKTIGADTNLEGTSEKQFSFAERILIKYLILSKDDLKPSNGFWEKLQNPGTDSSYQYLAEKFNEFGGKKAYGTPECDPETLAKALNQIVEKEKLEDEQWASNELASKPGFLDKFTNDDTGRPWRNRLLLELAFPDLIEKPLPGRALICFSYVGRYLSVTFRKINEKPGYKAPDETTRAENLFSLSEYCNLLYREIFEETGSIENAHGLLVITGATKSAKSEIARGLIHLYLERKGESDDNRRHHLVTFEDPVERFYVNEDVKTCSPWVAVELSDKVIRDYTPRQKKDDARLLQEALNDALRQTPAIFFVGETREPKEWEVLLEFAATGHLIVTTAHAGSLVEAMHRIFEAKDVNTSAERSEIANKLLGIIHLKRQAFKLAEDKTPGMLFPALWRRTPRGIASLTSEGLASLLPYRPTNQTGQRVDATSCLGRRWFTEQLINLDPASNEIKEALTKELAENLKTKAYEKATEWDLEGV